MEDSILNILANSNSPLSSTQIVELVDLQTRAVQRVLKRLVEEDRIVASGKGRARRYQLLTKKAKKQLVGWDENFLLSYVPNESFYLPEDTRQQLRKIGSPISTLPAGTYARRILDRLLIDLSWNSSRLEGNTYTLLDTEELLSGSRVEGRNDLETQMILNHKEAIEFLVDGADANSFDPFTLRSLHGILSENLLSDPASSGALRQIPVGISNSNFVPLAEPQRIEAAFETICDFAELIDDPFEASLFVLVHIPYLQPFVDVNKRVSRLAANIPFIRNNHHPLSFVDTDRDEYLHATLQVYESKNIVPIRDLFVEAYIRSSENYAVISQSIGQPDPFRLKYRGELKRAVAYLVKELIGNVDLEMLESDLLKGIDKDDLDQFQRTLDEEMRFLHLGNIARYRLRPAEFNRWKELA